MGNFILNNNQSHYELVKYLVLFLLKVFLIRLKHLINFFVLKDFDHKRNKYSAMSHVSRLIPDSRVVSLKYRADSRL